MLLKEQVPLAPYTTMSVGGSARYFAEAEIEADVEAAVAEANRLGVEQFVLGGGSNLLVSDQGFAGLVLHMAIRGMTESAPGLMDVGAGEDWDGFVRTATGKGYAGIECMAGIPGTVGGTPVQNVGAYGQEVADTIVSVRAFDRNTGAFVELSKQQCGFRYRQSIFNTTEQGRYIVTRVRYQLRPGGKAAVTYVDLQKRFAGGRSNPSLKDVADEVRDIRKKKGMLIVAGDPDCRSAGSFFKNPVIPVGQLTKIVIATGISEFEIPKWPVEPGKVKLPAAWLLEHAGFVKGFRQGRAGLSTKHTLAITNRGGATFEEIDALSKTIAAGVKQKFGIELEREPVVLS